MNDLTLLLGQSELFKSLSRENRRRLGDICLHHHVKKKQWLFLEGDKGSAVYLCIKGSIQLTKSGPGGQEVSIKVVRPGELFAEVILFETSRYPVTATALEDSRVLMIPKHQFDCLLQELSFRNDFMANLMSKLRFLTKQVQLLSVHDVEDRLFRFLRDQYGDRPEFQVNISKKDVASAIGTTPETLSRLLMRLKAEDRLIWDGKTVHLLKH